MVIDGFGADLRKFLSRLPVFSFDVEVEKQDYGSTDAEKGNLVFAGLAKESI